MVPEPAPIPRTLAQIAEAAQARGLTIPEACAEGVAASLALLSVHAERLRTPPAGEAR